MPEILVTQRFPGTAVSSARLVGQGARQAHHSNRFPENVHMTRNIGSADRIVRIVLGLALIALAFVGPRTPLGWIGVVPLLTAFVRFCPAYAIFGLSTCPVAERRG